MEKIVAHLKNGEIVKGHSTDFFPEKAIFNLINMIDPLCTEEIRLDNLKALFFVKDFRGDFLHVDSHDFNEAPVPGKHIIITFCDGEILFATSEMILIDETGFFIYSIDPESNTIRAFVINSFIESIDVVG